VGMPDAGPMGCHRWRMAAGPPRGDTKKMTNGAVKWRISCTQCNANAQDTIRWLTCSRKTCGRGPRVVWKQESRDIVEGNVCTRCLQHFVRSDSARSSRCPVWVGRVNGEPSPAHTCWYQQVWRSMQSFVQRAMNKQGSGRGHGEHKRTASGDGAGLASGSSLELAGWAADGEVGRTPDRNEELPQAASGSGESPGGDRRAKRAKVGPAESTFGVRAEAEGHSRVEVAEGKRPNRQDDGQHYVEPDGGEETRAKRSRLVASFRSHCVIRIGNATFCGTCGGVPLTGRGSRDWSTSHCTGWVPVSEFSSFARVLVNCGKPAIGAFVELLAERRAEPSARR